MATSQRNLPRNYTNLLNLHFDFWNEHGYKIDAENDVFRASNIGGENAILELERTKLSNVTYHGDWRDNIHRWSSTCDYLVKDIKSADVEDGSHSWGGAIIYNHNTGKAIFVSNAIWQIYTSSAVGGPCSPLGAPKPTSGFVHGQWRWDHYAEVEVTWSKYGDHGWVQRFDNGSTYFSAGQNAGYPVYGEISDIYEAAGGTGGVYGFPTSNPYQDGGRTCQNFRGGKICAGSTPSSEFDKAKRAFERREREKGNVEKDGNIHMWCHYIVQDYHKIGNHGDSILIYNPWHDQAYMITGGIWWSYYTNGGCSEFGMPLHDEDRTGRVPGWRQPFEHADIYWAEHHGKSQPGIVKGEIRDRFNSMGGTSSYLGFPEGKQYRKDSGWCQDFQGGKLCTGTTESEKVSKVKDYIKQALNKMLPTSSNRDWGYRELRGNIAKYSTNNKGTISRIPIHELHSLQEWIKQQQDLYKEDLKRDEKLRWFFNAIYVRNLRTLARSGVITDLEAFAQGAEFIAEYWDDSDNGRYNFERDLAVVFGNTKGRDSIFYSMEGDMTAAYYVSGFVSTGFANYFRDSKYFTESRNNFDDYPAEVPPNVPFHVTAGGINFAFAGDKHCHVIFCATNEEWMTWHETAQYKTAGHYDFKEPHPDGDCGTSWEDLFSSYVAIDLDRDLRNGNVKIREFGNQIRYRFGNTGYDLCSDFVDRVPRGSLLKPQYWDIKCEDIPYDRVKGYWYSDKNAIFTPEHCPSPFGY